MPSKPTKGAPSAADFAPKKETVTLPSGRDITLLSQAPSIFALAARGEIALSAISGEEEGAEEISLDKFEFAAALCRTVIVAPPLSMDEEPPAGHISYSWLTDDDINFICSRNSDLSEQTEEEAATFRDGPEGPAATGDSETVEA